MHHVLITYCTLKSIYFALTVFVRDAAVRYVLCQEGLNPHNYPGFRLSVGELCTFHMGRPQNSHIQTTYKPHTNHKKPSVSSHTLAPTTICDLSHSDCGSPLTDLGRIRSATYVCHPLWFVCGHRKGILTSP